MKLRSTGFTLIEIAIVLVIIGLLLGGVLKGQELIANARVRNLISQQDGVKAAFYGFQDRFRALPGDYALASANINCGATPCLNGNGNGQIESSATPASGSEIHEELLSWSHLSAAGFIGGSYLMIAGESAPTDINNPKNPYSSYLQLITDANYGIGTPQAHQNLKTGNNVTVEVLVEVDRKIDDGLPNSGAFQFSAYAPPGGTAPTGSGGCLTSGASPIWDVAGSNTNCGAASLF